jgi:ubiquinone/menaquinone biosynthesis C-methylase UbiE
MLDVVQVEILNILFQKGASVTGIDLSSGLIKLAEESYPQVKFIVGDMTSLPFADMEFDGIWAHASILHLETIKAVQVALDEFNRVLKKGGILHVLVKAQTGINKTAIVKDKLTNHDRFFQFFTQKELKKLLTKAGFDVFKIEQYNETLNNHKGRPEVDWIVSLSRKKKF